MLTVLLVVELFMATCAYLVGASLGAAKTADGRPALPDGVVHTTYGLVGVFLVGAFITAAVALA